jgi:hypothetical protein
MQNRFLPKILFAFVLLATLWWLYSPINARRITYAFAELDGHLQRSRPRIEAVNEGLYRDLRFFVEAFPDENRNITEVDQLPLFQAERRSLIA